jgi:hypothetical protein
MKKKNIVYFRTQAGISVKCELRPFPYLELLQGMVAHLMSHWRHYYDKYPKALEECGKRDSNVQLAYDPKFCRWWLYYAGEGCAMDSWTGSFESRRKAIEWFVNAGR